MVTHNKTHPGFPAEPEQKSIYIVVLVKGQERYVFVYEGTEIMNTFGRFAADDELSFTWYDAAILSTYVRQNLGRV